MSRDESVLTVEIIDQDIRFTLRELCERGGCHGELILKMVNYGIIEPVSTGEPGPEGNLEFDLAALARLRKAMRLQQDLKLNLPGLAMSLDLLDEVDAMRREIEHLRQQLDQFSEDS